MDTYSLTPRDTPVPQEVRSSGQKGLTCLGVGAGGHVFWWDRDSFSPPLSCRASRVLLIVASLPSSFSSSSFWVRGGLAVTMTTAMLRCVHQRPAAPPAGGRHAARGQPSRKEVKCPLPDLQPKAHLKAFDPRAAGGLVSTAEGQTPTTTDAASQRAGSS